MNFEQWLKAQGISEFTALAEPVQKTLKASFEASQTPPTPGVKPPNRVEDVLATAKAETERREKIADITAQFLADTPQRDADFIAKIEALATLAIEAKWTADKYDTELLRASRPAPSMAMRFSGRERGVNGRVVEAAIAMTGRLSDAEKSFDDQTLQAAHDHFRGGIGLKQVILMCAEAHGYRGGYSSQVTAEAQNYAFGLVGRNHISASGGFSSLDISTILSNNANKFLRDGWNAIDLTPLRLAAVRPVSDFKTITTVSLTGDLMFEEVGAGGEIKHGTLGELSYSNKADTYARMLSITRQDIINDDLGALTSVPRRLGRGAALKLNDIFWTVFLNAETAGFFAAGNNNLNTGVADVTVGGLEATETIFMSQTDPDGKPLGTMPKIVVVPTAKHSAMRTLMESEKLIDGTSTAKQGDTNVWRGRFRVESSPYMHNTSYTGYSAVAWYMLADPADLPMIEIAALAGRVEPVVETADAEFNVLGVQMRGYSDVGVALQEKRAAVKADGGAS